MLRNLILALVVFAGFSGCKKNDFCEDYNYCSNTAILSEIQAVQDYLTQNNITATKHCSGVFYSIERPGTGESPDICSRIGFTYTGRLTNGNVFDQSTQVVEYPLGNLIAGWQNTLPLLKEGGKIHLYIPPSLGYGNQDQRDANGNVLIPANSIIVFELELVSVGD